MAPTSLLLALGAALALGCAREVVALAPSSAPVPDRVPLDEYRFERAGAPVLECARADQLLAAPGLAESWPLEIRRSEAAARKSGELWPRDQLFFFGRRELGGSHTRAARLGDRLHFFYTRGVPSADCEVRCVDVARGTTVLLDTMDPLSGKVGVRFGAFDVDAFGGRLLVVYGTPSDAHGSPSELRRVWVTPGDEGIEASAPEVIFRGNRRVFDVELVAGEGRVDLLWQFGSRLSYSSLRDPDGKWSPEVVLSETANPVASLAVDGDLVCAAWSDGRYEKIRGLAPINGRKLVLRSSSDGGRTFGPLLLVDDPVDEKDDTLLTRFSFAGERPALFCRSESAESWRHLLFARDLRGYWELPSVSSRKIEQAYEARMRPLLER